MDPHAGFREPNGWFKLGNPGSPGRPKGLDFRAVIAEKSAREGVDVSEVIWAVFKAMVRAAGSGDVQAAKMIMDRLCDIDPQELRVNVSMAGPPMPPEPELIKGIEHLNALRSRLLAEAFQSDAEPSTNGTGPH